MKKFFVSVFLSLVILMGAMDLFARRGGGGFRSSRSSYSSSRSSSYGSRSSSRSSKSYGSGYKSTKPSKKTYSKPISKQKMATMKQNRAKIRQQKATNADAKKFKNITKNKNYSKVDKELSKSIGKSGKTFKSRSEAKSAMSSKMATKTYNYKDSKVAMSNRPSYVPQNVTINNHSYPTAYYGGHYGYYNPAGSFIAYTATNMLVTDMMLHSYGYRPTYAPVAQTHVVHHNSNGSTIGTIFFAIILFLIVIIVVGVLINTFKEDRGIY